MGSTRTDDGSAFTGQLRQHAVSAWTWLRQLPSDEHVPRWAAALGVVLSLPTLVQGKLLDDHMLHAAALRGASPLEFELLRAPVVQLREQGTLGWWAHDELQLSFLRPLAAVTHALDFRLWPHATWVMHLENVLLYGLLILVVGRVLQRLLGPGPIAGLACLLFAIDELHATAVMWISGRNTILAALFGLLALAAHMRWRSRSDSGTSRWAFALAGPLCFALALASAEGGIGALGYLLAFALTHERGAWARVGPMLPYLVIVVIWRVMYTQLDLGPRASGLYVDPGDDLLGFAGAAIVHVPALGFVALSLPLADVLTTAPPELAYFAALGFVGLVWVLAPLYTDRNAQFLMLGMLASAVPLATTAASSRTMLTLSLGSAGLLAIAWSRRDELFTGRLRKLGLRFMAGCQLVLAPLLFVPLSFASSLAEAPHRALAEIVPETDQTVAIVNIPMEINGLYPQLMREVDGRAWPEHCYVLHAGFGAVSVERIDEHTLELHSDGGWAATRVDQLSRDWARAGMAAGDHVELQRARFEVIDVTQDARPARVRVRFVDDLDDVILLRFDGPVPSRWEPVVGEHAVLVANVVE
jgi:hypothetical protein